MTRNSPYHAEDGLSVPAHHPTPEPQPGSPQAPRKRRRRRQQPRSGPRPSWALRILVAGLLVIALPLGTLAAVMLIASPGKVLRAKLIRQVSNRIGRDIEIRGGLTLVASPQPGIILSRIVVPPPDGMPGPAALTARSLRLDLAIAPLMQGRAVVDKATLIDPTINLRVDRDGRRNWQISRRKRTRLQSRGSRRIAIGPTSALAGTSPRMSFVERLGRSEFALKTLVVENGTVHYQDDRSANRQTLTALNLALSAPGFDTQMRANGSATWRDRQLTLDGRLETLQRLIARQSAKASVTIASGDARAGFEGTVQVADRVGAVGQVGVSVASLDHFIDWLGMRSTQSSPFGRLEVGGYISYGGDNIQLGGARLAIGAMQATGAIAVKLGRARPAISGDLKVSQLDADRLAAILRITPKANIATLRPGPNATTPGGIDDLLRGGEATGGVARFSLRPDTPAPAAAWQTDPFDVRALHSADISMRLAIEGLKLGGLQFARTRFSLQLNDGSLRAKIDDGQLYGGRVDATLTARPSVHGLAIALNCFAERVAVGDLLTDMAGIGTLTGTTRVAAKLSAIGRSRQSIMSSVAGTARIVLAKGSVAGWDVSALLEELKRGRIPELKYTPSEKTDFRELSATFAVDEGVARTRDLRMITDLFGTQGAGEADIGRRRLDILTRSQLAPARRKNDERKTLEDLVLPIRVRGDWTRPSVRLEIENAFKNPDKARKALRKARKRFKGRDPKEVLRGILRDGKKSEDLRAAKKVLKDLFR